MFGRLVTFLAQIIWIGINTSCFGNQQISSSSSCNIKSDEKSTKTNL